MKELKPEDIESIARLIASPYVHHSDLFQIFIDPIMRGFIVTYQSGKSDMGRLIGKGGITFRAMKQLLQLFGSQHYCKITLQPIQPSLELEIAAGSGADMMSVLYALCDRLVPDLVNKKVQKLSGGDDILLSLRLKRETLIYVPAALTARLRDYVSEWQRNSGRKVQIDIQRDERNSTSQTRAA